MTPDQWTIVPLISWRFLFIAKCTNPIARSVSLFIKEFIFLLTKKIAFYILAKVSN